MNKQSNKKMIIILILVFVVIFAVGINSTQNLKKSSSEKNYDKAISYLNKAKTLPEEFKNKANFQKEFINIIQQLMFNEIEISLFTLNIDYFGWKDENYNYKIHLIFIGLKTKMNLKILYLSLKYLMIYQAIFLF